MRDTPPPSRRVPRLDTSPASRGGKRALTFAALVALFCVAVAARAEEAPAPRSTAIDFATPQPVIDLRPSAAPRGLEDPSDPNGAWFTIAVQNRGAAPSARVLTAADPPGAGLAIMPPAGRPMLLEAAGSDPAVVIERAVAFGPNAFRVFV